MLATKTVKRFEIAIQINHFSSRVISLKWYKRFFKVRGKIRRNFFYSTPFSDKNRSRMTDKTASIDFKAEGFNFSINAKRQSLRGKNKMAAGVGAWPSLWMSTTTTTTATTPTTTTPGRATTTKSRVVVNIIFSLILSL